MHLFNLLRRSCMQGKQTKMLTKRSLLRSTLVSKSNWRRTLRWVSPTRLLSSLRWTLLGRYSFQSKGNSLCYLHFWNILNRYYIHVGSRVRNTWWSCIREQCNSKIRWEGWHGFPFLPVFHIGKLTVISVGCSHSLEGWQPPLWLFYNWICKFFWFHWFSCLTFLVIHICFCGLFITPHKCIQTLG